MTYRSYYTSQDTNADDSPWSVYSELWTDDNWENGEPIDGSQRHVVSLSGERTADNFANDLYRMFGGQL